MSEADTIRDALAPMGPSRRARIDAALTALERRAEQEVIRAEHAEAGLSLLNADRERAERRAEQAEQDRDGWRDTAHAAQEQALAFNGVIAKLRARAEQAEAALREAYDSLPSNGVLTARGILHAALAATTPGEPHKCPPGCEGNCDGV